MRKLSNGWIIFTDLMSQRPSKNTKARGSEAPQEEPVQRTQQQQESPQDQPGQVAGLPTETPSDLKASMESPSPSTSMGPSPSAIEPPKSEPNES